MEINQNPSTLTEFTETSSAVSAAPSAGAGLFEGLNYSACLIWAHSEWYITLTVTACCPFTLSQGGGGGLSWSGLDQGVCVSLCVCIVWWCSGWYWDDWATADSDLVEPYLYMLSVSKCSLGAGDKMDMCVVCVCVHIIQKWDFFVMVF